MTSIATLLSYPINQRSRGTAHATFFFALTKVERIIYHIIILKFKVPSSLLSLSPGVSCLSRVSLSSADNTIVAWLWPDGEGTTTTGAFSVETEWRFTWPDFDEIDFEWIVFFIYVFFCSFHIILLTSMANSFHKTWHRHLVQKSLREKDKFQMTCYFL